MNSTDRGAPGAKKPPRLFTGAFSGTIYCTSKYRERPENPGLFEVTGERFDVTNNAIEVVVAYITDREVFETDKDGTKYRLTIVREKVEKAS